MTTRISYVALVMAFILGVVAASFAATALTAPTRSVVEPIELSASTGDGPQDRDEPKGKPGDRKGQEEPSAPSQPAGESGTSTSGDSGAAPAPGPPPVRAGDDSDDRDDEIDDDDDDSTDD